MPMSWKQFKEEIDRQMTAEGISQDEPIEYIDVTRPSLERMADTPTVYKDRKSGKVFIECG